ncbi:hypothetical protein PG994_010971 [Apiospora phragmitis]|uniref:Uncharacterized protein n=1 Tax=Apiospora phragmitis TaxID=2905665 RepID=A0ABR1TRJ4_9PEZI
MGVGSQPSEKKAMKATVENEIPVRQPAPKAQESQQPGGQPQNSRPSRLSSRPEKAAAPAFRMPGQWHHPSFGQQPNIHQIPGQQNCTHSQSGPTLAVPFSYNNLPGFHNFGDLPSSNATFLHSHNLHHNNNFGFSGQPFLANTHYFSSFVRHPSILLADMADYGTGSMPNTGQHFQPPVPDTTYGPIRHTYYPRSDCVHHVMMGNPVMSGNNQSAPCACQAQLGAMPQVVHQVAAGFPHGNRVVPGASTAPHPVGAVGAGYNYAHHQPTIIQTGHAVQPIGGAGGQPFYPHGFAGPSGQPMQAQPAMMPGGMPGGMSAGGPGMGFPVSGQGPVFIGNAASGFIPPGSLPDVMGVGKTVSETQAEQMQSAHDQGALEPQDFKPADDDPSRMYFCRELDGNWILRNRYTLDNIPIRWYVTTSGVFYAVRLEE